MYKIDSHKGGCFLVLARWLLDKTKHSFLGCGRYFKSFNILILSTCQKLIITSIIYTCCHSSKSKVDETNGCPDLTNCWEKKGWVCVRREELSDNRVMDWGGERWIQYVSIFLVSKKLFGFSINFWTYTRSLFFEKYKSCR